MRKLKIDWSDFEIAAEADSAESRGYVQLQTGAVFSVTNETAEQLQELLAVAAADASIDAVIAAAEVPDWQKDALREAWTVEESLGHYLDVSEVEFSDEYRDLEDFTATVEDPAVRRQLEAAIEGPGAFRRFRNVVHGTILEREQWYAFQANRRRETAAAWLAGHDIEVEWILPAPSTRPRSRDHLLAGVLVFVRAVQQLPGVTRIALLGSLTGDKPEPKDVDMLVTVSDEIDLTPLAKAGRKLGGHAQQLNRGVDVFLANERGEYIGRTCHWRECGPRFRATCDALHCGQRHYLHDDFRALRLKKAVIEAPPIELWPQVNARVTPPADVERLLLAPLRTQQGS
ncbi:MAG TPA: UPF0158 family protein [Opitutaceae bacterium]|nr:UPF0158 family protein [Opitutaceae bacterium]